VSSDIQPKRPRVLVLGGGFGGIGAARELKDADADVVVVDRHDYHTFQPLLYQLATALLEPTAVGHSLRDLFNEHPNVSIHQATVTGIQVDKREVSFKETPPLGYDYLVVGLGAEVNFFDVEGTQENAFPMYTLEDALKIRSHVLRRWEAAEHDPTLVEDGALNVVIVGGGPTGVESAGALAELYRHDFARDFPQLPPEKARLILVEASPELFGMFKSDLRKYAKKALEERGVEVMVGEVVQSVAPTRVTLKSGKVIKAHTLIWGAGLQANPLGRSLDVELQRGNRVPVEPDLSVAGHREVFAVGDIAWIMDTKTGEVLPQLGSVALQAGEHAGENITRRLEGKETKPFEYKDKGTMATIGRGAAVVQFRRGRTMKGRAAFLAWGAVHLVLLSSGEDRAKALIDWTWAGLAHERTGRITIGSEGE
jgi:NADH:ubiquinone reductase (H+-translocating)